MSDGEDIRNELYGDDSSSEEEEIATRPIKKEPMEDENEEEDVKDGSSKSPIIVDEKTIQNERPMGDMKEPMKDDDDDDDSSGEDEEDEDLNRPLSKNELMDRRKKVRSRLIRGKVKTGLADPKLDELLEDTEEEDGTLSSAGERERQDADDLDDPNLGKGDDMDLHASGNEYTQEVPEDEDEPIVDEKSVFETPVDRDSDDSGDSGVEFIKEQPITRRKKKRKKKKKKKKKKMKDEDEDEMSDEEVKKKPKKRKRKRTPKKEMINFRKENPVRRIKLLKSAGQVVYRGEPTIETSIDETFILDHSNACYMLVKNIDGSESIQRFVIRGNSFYSFEPGSFHDKRLDCVPFNEKASTKIKKMKGTSTTKEKRAKIRKYTLKIFQKICDGEDWGWFETEEKTKLSNGLKIGYPFMNIKKRGEWFENMIKDHRYQHNINEKVKDNKKKRKNKKRKKKPEEVTKDAKKAVKLVNKKIEEEDDAKKEKTEKIKKKKKRKREEEKKKGKKQLPSTQKEIEKVVTPILLPTVGLEELQGMVRCIVAELLVHLADQIKKK